MRGNSREFMRIRGIRNEEKKNYDGRKMRVFYAKSNMAGVSKMIERSNVTSCVYV